jgi:hypothetical protein
MSSAGLEPAISAIGLPQAYASDRTVTGIGEILHEARIRGKMAAYFKVFLLFLKANWDWEGDGPNVIQVYLNVKRKAYWLGHNSVWQ